MNDRDECMQTAKMQCAGLVSSWTVVRNPVASMKSLVSGPETVKEGGGAVGDSVHSLCGRQSGNQGSVSSVRQTLPITRRHSTILYIPAGNSTNHSHFLSVSLLLDCDCLQKFVYNKSTHPDEPLNQYRGQKVLVVGLGMRPSPAPVSHTTLAAPNHLEVIFGKAWSKSAPSLLFRIHRS